MSQHVSLFFFLVSRIWCVKFPAHPSELPRHLKLLLLEYDQRQLSCFQDVVMEIISVFVYEGCRSQRLCIYTYYYILKSQSCMVSLCFVDELVLHLLDHKIPRSLRLILAKKFFSGTAALGEPSWRFTTDQPSDSTDSPRRLNATHSRNGLAIGNKAHDEILSHFNT